MSFKTHLKKERTVKTVQAVLSVFFFLFFIQISYLLLHGEQGYFALKGVEHRLEEVSLEHDLLLFRRQSIEAHVKGLRPQSIDKDLLDERARLVLGMIPPEEQVLLNF